MTDLPIFILGLLVTAITVAAVLLVGRAESLDPAHNRSGSGTDRT